MEKPSVISARASPGFRVRICKIKIMYLYIDEDERRAYWACGVGYLAFLSGSGRTSNGV